MELPHAVALLTTYRFPGRFSCRAVASHVSAGNGNVNEDRMTFFFLLFTSMCSLLFTNLISSSRFFFFFFNFTGCRCLLFSPPSKASPYWSEWPCERHGYGRTVYCIAMNCVGDSERESCERCKENERKKKTYERRGGGRINRSDKDKLTKPSRQIVKLLKIIPSIHNNLCKNRNHGMKQ